MRYAHAVGVVSLVLALSPGVARAGGGEHCTLGDVMAAFNTWGGAMRVLIGSNSPSAVEDGRSLCSYRSFGALGETVFTEPDDDHPAGVVEYVEPICYCERDYILAGMALRFQSRQDAVETHESYVPFLYWSGVQQDGTTIPEEPLDLRWTPVEVWLATGFAVWYQIAAVLTPLDPGEYQSRLSDDSGDPDVVINVHVLSHASAHTGGPARNVQDGSVVCP